MEVFFSLLNMKLGTNLSFLYIFIVFTAQLLNAIYTDAKARQHEHKAVKDITVETPSPEFTYLRDLTDLRNCSARGYFKTKMPRTMPPETFKAIMTDLRLCAVRIPIF